MTTKKTASPELLREWVLPASIPFAELKARDLEECVYWLLDAMGAKDLEWRTGGKGGGAADGGRDLEARFYTPAPDGEIEGQKWWIECKGRTGTVEPDEVKSAVNNSAAVVGLDYIVIATNTQFSNPTRDWVEKWQEARPKPKIKLWDHTQLERYLSRHPEVVLRLFSEALSLDGRFKAMEARFWNKMEFVAPGMLADLWAGRNELSVTAMGIFAAIANEFAHGEIASRPWAGAMDAQAVLEVLSIASKNVFYLAMRCSDAGIDQEIVIRALAYLVLAALDNVPAELVMDCIYEAITRGEGGSMPEDAQDLLIIPILGQLQSEIQDVCASDCKRVTCLDRNALRDENDEVENYWLRLEPIGQEKTDPGRVLRIEKYDEPCLVGFAVDKSHSCPLFGIEPRMKTLGEMLAVIKRVAAFRKSQATEKRKVEKEKSEQRRKTQAKVADH